MNIAILRKLLKLFFRFARGLAGLVFLSVSLTHIFSAGSSSLGEGLQLLGLFTLPPMPLWLAVLVGLMILPASVMLIVQAFIPKRVYRQLTK